MSTELKLYDNPLPGVYTYRRPEFNQRDAYGRPTLKTKSMKVEVLGEKKTQYLIRFLEWHIDGRKPGSTTLVKKTSVKCPDREIPKKGYTPICRLPYKD